LEVVQPDVVNAAHKAAYPEGRRPNTDGYRTLALSPGAALALAALGVTSQVVPLNEGEKR
jgi:hypothetical protein